MATIIIDGAYTVTTYPSGAVVRELTPVAPPPPPKMWPAFDFYRKFTSAERIAVRNLAKTDMIADDFLRTLDNTIAASANVRADDPDTIAGIGYLQTVPAGNPVLTAARAAAIMA